MKENSGVKTAVIVLAATVFAVCVLVGAFLLNTGRAARGGIVLPSDADQEQVQNPELDNTLFLTVTPENVQTVIADLTRPEQYHQSLQKQQSYGAEAASAQLEIWHRDGVSRIDVSSGGTVRHCLTDGATAYVWYGTDRSTLQVTLDADYTADDLLGVPTYETVLEMEPSELTESSYVNQDDRDCIQVVFATAAETTETFWVDLQTGLLLRSEIRYGEETVSSVEQTALETGEAEPGAWDGQFRLPNGNAPF